METPCDPKHKPARDSKMLVSLPTVDIPKDFQLDKHGYLVFQIATADGCVQVECWRGGFSCKGTAEALAACGLLQIDWLPGTPENNSVRQSVVFNEGQAILLRGRRRGVSNPGQCLIITRRSRVRYEVRVPTTKAQKEFIHEIEEHRERKAEGEKIADPYKPKSPGEFRHDWLHMVEISMSLNLGRAEKCGLCFNEESMARINRAYSELHRAIEGGGVIQSKSDLHRDGNVIYLGPHPAD